MYVKYFKSKYIFIQYYLTRTSVKNILFSTKLYQKVLFHYGNNNRINKRQVIIERENNKII